MKITIMGFGTYREIIPFKYYGLNPMLENKKL